LIEKRLIGRQASILFDPFLIVAPPTDRLDTHPDSHPSSPATHFLSIHVVWNDLLVVRKLFVADCAHATLLPGLVIWSLLHLVRRSQQGALMVQEKVRAYRAIPGSRSTHGESMRNAVSGWCENGFQAQGLSKSELPTISFN
jgi:hypothetical protein